jgi:hypothetical protein
MIKLNLLDFFDEKRDGIDLASIRNTAAAAGHPLGALVDDMALLKTTLENASDHEASHTALTDRLRDGYIIDLFLGHRKGVDPEIGEKMGYTSTWVNSRFIIAFCKPGNTADNSYQHHPFDQFTSHPQDQWGHVNNDMLIELLHHYALTQVVMLPENAPRNNLPQGMDLLKLVQLRLGADRMHRGMPGMPGFNQMQNRGYSYGQPVFNQPMYHQPPIWGNGNAFFTEQMPPQSNNGRYDRQPFNGSWVWYPTTPFFVEVNVERTTDNLRETLDAFIRNIAKNMDGHLRGGYDPIKRLLNEIDVTLEHGSDVVELFLNDQVTLFVGHRGQLPQAVSEHVNNDFTNWALIPGKWDPLTNGKPTKVINTIGGIAKYIGGYMDYPSMNRPNMF